MYVIHRIYIKLYVINPLFIYLLFIYFKRETHEHNPSIPVATTHLLLPAPMGSGHRLDLVLVLVLVHLLFAPLPTLAHGDDDDAHAFLFDPTRVIQLSWRPRFFPTLVSSEFSLPFFPVPFYHNQASI